MSCCLVTFTKVNLDLEVHILSWQFEYLRNMEDSAKHNLP